MDETQSQYLERIAGYVQGKDHFKVLCSTVLMVDRLIRHAPRRRLLSSSAPGAWSAGEILAHLAESELVFSYRLRRVLAVNGATVEAFDQNQWQANAGYLKRNPKKAFQLFRVLRDNNIDLLNSLTKEQWNSYGMHEERGRENIARMIELYAGHDVNHVKQIEGIVNSNGTAKRKKRKKSGTK